MPLDVDVPLETSSLSRRAYEILKEQIVRGNLAPGERLDIHALAQKLKISRTPIKEAINYLAQQGLVKIHSRRGTFFSTLEPKNIQELFDIRLMIELWSAEQALRHPGSLNMKTIEELMDEACSLFRPDANFDYTIFTHCDAEFHLAIVDAAQNSRLSELYRSLHPHIEIMRVHWGRARDRAFKSHEEHLRILEALQQANVRQAVDALTTHILNTRDHTLNLLPSLLGSPG
jgi:DNA-binding GntR family transcriptional regulator